MSKRLDALRLVHLQVLRRLGGRGVGLVEAGENGLRLLHEEGAEHQGEDQDDNNAAHDGTDDNASELTLGEAVAGGLLVAGRG